MTKKLIQKYKSTLNVKKKLLYVFVFILQDIDALRFYSTMFRDIYKEFSNMSSDLREDYPTWNTTLPAIEPRMRELHNTLRSIRRVR